MILAFANNHYAGHGPWTVDLFRRLWGMEAPRVVRPLQRTDNNLFSSSRKALQQPGPVDHFVTVTSPSANAPRQWTGSCDPPTSS